MFERFTERARQVVVLAQEDSRKRYHNYIGVGHLLMGLIREEEGLASRALDSLDITESSFGRWMDVNEPDGDETTSGQIPFTPRAKLVLELALREALSLGHNYIGTEHILLGLMREEQGAVADYLREREITAGTVRSGVMFMLSGPGGRKMPASIHEPAESLPVLIIEGSIVTEVDGEQVEITHDIRNYNATLQGDFKFGDKVRITIEKLP